MLNSTLVFTQKYFVQLLKKWHTSYTHILYIPFSAVYIHALAIALYFNGSHFSLDCFKPYTK